MPFDPGVKPSRRVAETLADVIAPRRAFKQVFLDAGGLTQLAACPVRDFRSKEASIFLAGNIAQARPYEMENLVNGNETKRGRLRQQLRFKNDLPATNEAGGMNGNAAARRARQQLTAVGHELRQYFQMDWAAGQFRQPGKSG
jgi:hypothetical protein